MVFSILGPVIGLAVVGGIIALLVGAGRRRSTGAGGIDSRSVRRFFQYLLLYILFVVVTIGLAELLGRLLGSSAGQSQDGSSALARALAFVIIGLPLAAALTWWTWRNQRADAAEVESPLLTVYLTLMTLTALVMTAASIQAIVAEAISRARFDGASAGQFVAWGALWFVHQTACGRLLRGERGDPQLVLGSLVGLVVGAYGLAVTLGTSLDLLVRPGIFVRPGIVLAQAGGMLVAGALVWVWYWARSMINRTRTDLWLAYVLLAGVGGGLILALVEASRVLWTVLVWFAGDRLGRTAVQHFDSTAVESAAVLVGLLLWWYHRTVLGQSAAQRNEVRRVYEYLVSGIALVAAAAGVGTVVAGFIEAVTPGLDTGMTTQNTLLAAVTLLVVGVPVWWVHWGRIRSATSADPPGEVASPTRRIYLILLFGVAGITAVVALLTAGFMFFRDVVDAHVGLVTLRSMRYALGVLLASAAVSAYHGSIFRQDRTVAVPARVAGPESVVLVGADDPDLAQAIHRATGARVELWERLDGDPEAWDEASVLEALGGHSGQEVLVIAAGPGLDVIVLGDRHR